MKLKTIYPTQEEIPEGYQDLYTERNGQWEFNGVEGVKTQADIDRVQSALVKERNDHKATKEALKPFEGLDATTIQEQLNELESTRAQLEAVNKDGRIDETKLEPIIAARLKQATAPLERDKANLERKLQDQLKLTEAEKNAVNELKHTITTGDVRRAISDAAIKLKVLQPAIADAVLHGQNIFEITEDGRIITRDGRGATPGLTPEEWLKDMQDRAPHWWPASVGGGSGGGKGPASGNNANNPWSKAGWNITKQGQYLTQHGDAKAAAAAESVGSSVGATRPPAG